MPTDTTSDLRREFIVLLLLGLAIGIAVTFLGRFSGFDLAPMWIAAILWAEGNPDAIYNTGDILFSTSGPPAFELVAERLGFDFVVHAFIYPPLWAALLAPLTGLMSFETFNAIVLFLNTVSLFLAVWFVWRSAPLMPLARHAALGAALLCLGTTALIALAGNQVHIFVTLLLAICFERLRHGDEITAGALLALAASLKLFPALLAVLFLARGEYRAFVSFTVVGLSLGTVSIAIAGWPLHDALLQQLSIITHTILMVGPLWNFDSLVILLLGPETAGFQVEAAVGARHLLWVWFGRVAPVLFLAYLAWRIRSNGAERTHPLFWPYAVLGTAFLGPVSWAFNYILPLMAAPVLLVYWPRLSALLFLAVIVMFTSVPFVSVSGILVTSMPPLQVTGSLSVFALLIAFDRTLFRGTRNAWAQSSANQRLHA